MIIPDSVKKSNSRCGHFGHSILYPPKILSVDYGALVLRGQTTEDLAVIPGSPADKAGLEEYDIILELDGQKIDEDHSLASLIRTKMVGDTVTLKILHDGEEKDVTITLEERPS